MNKVLKRILVGLAVIVFGVGAFFLGFYVRNLSSPDMVSLKFVIDHYKKYYYEEQDRKYIHFRSCARWGLLYCEECRRFLQKCKPFHRYILSMSLKYGHSKRQARRGFRSLL